MAVRCVRRPPVTIGRLTSAPQGAVPSALRDSYRGFAAGLRLCAPLRRKGEEPDFLPRAGKLKVRRLTHGRKPGDEHGDESEAERCDRR